MDDIEKILEKLTNLESSITKLKEELEELKSNQQEEGYSKKDDLYNIAHFFDEIFSTARNLKRQVRHELRRSMRRSFREGHEGFDYDFSFDFENLGEFISRTVNGALSSLDNISDSFDFDFDRPKMVRVKVQPGSNIKFETVSQEPDVLPSLDNEIQATKVLDIFEHSILSLEDLANAVDLDQATLEVLIQELKDKKIIIQEQSGRMRYLITKLGRKILHELHEKKNGEQNNN